MISTIMAVIEFCFTIVIGIYFLTMLKGQFSSKNSIYKDSTTELERLKKMNDIKLSMPLTEKTRPQKVCDIVGQDEGIKALKAALFGENPQHILIYGPPGVGKTAAARVVLDEAKKSKGTPFLRDAKFVEVDATTMQFDERSIADPLIGSVHDPIYQGAGAYGPAGVPQPKEGAVTKAHGGVLFIDEIGELPHMQINRLLKVLEDRRVFFDSSYYSRRNKDIPKHIHEVFQNGLPADFRLIGATTRHPEEIPPAVRSRCMEIYFKALSVEDIEKIVLNATKGTGVEFKTEAIEMICQYADNGRDAVNLVQMAQSVAKLEKKEFVTVDEIEWVVEMGKFSPRYEKKLIDGKRTGCAHGLAVFGEGQGCVLDVEAVAIKCERGEGELIVTGAIDEEEISNNEHRFKKKSSIDASVKNVITLIRSYFNVDVENYKIHINFPNSVPVDGPSAGVAIFCAVYSAVNNLPISSRLAMTGEISINGEVCVVGEVPLKINTAINSGAEKIIIPSGNYREKYMDLASEIIPISTVLELIDVVFDDKNLKSCEIYERISSNIGIISAEGVDISKKK